MSPSSATKKNAHSIRMIFPPSAYTAEQLQYLEAAVANGQCVEYLATLDPWSLEAAMRAPENQAILS